MLPDEERSPFKPYVPKLISHRLELRDSPYKGSQWKPSISYKYKLHDIQNQFTPAEYYRHQLQTSGKHIRMIQRLEQRISWKKKDFEFAALRIQALYRGNVGRDYFASIRLALEQERAERIRKEAALRLFHQGEYLKCHNFV